jgi:hypothetical protein
VGRRDGQRAGRPPPPVPLDLDRLQIRLEGSRQKAIALGWWDTHLDDLYADLGLPRDHHLTRGEN